MLQGQTSSFENVAFWGNERDVNKCIERGCHINGQDQIGDTAIIVAYCTGQIACVQRLFKLCANTTITNKYNCDAFYVAQRFVYSSIQTIFIPPQLLQELMKEFNFIKIIKI